MSVSGVWSLSFYTRATVTYLRRPPYMLTRARARDARGRIREKLHRTEDSTPGQLAIAFAIMRCQPYSFHIQQKCEGILYVCCSSSSLPTCVYRKFNAAPQLLSRHIYVSEINTLSGPWSGITTAFQISVSFMYITVPLDCNQCSTGCMTNSVKFKIIYSWYLASLPTCPPTELTQQASHHETVHCALDRWVW